MPGAMPQAILMSPRWGYAWGGAPGYINVAPLGLCLNAIKLRALHVGLPLQTVM